MVALRIGLDFDLLEILEGVERLWQRPRALWLQHTQVVQRIPEQARWQ